MKPKFLFTGSKVTLICLVLIIAASPFLASRAVGLSAAAPTEQRSSDETTSPSKPTAPLTQTMGISQTLSDEAQRNTIAFDGLAFLTGSLGADSFFPPGKVADFWGFQYLRDNDLTQMGHNPLFLTSAAFNMWNVLTTDQRAQLVVLANAQVASINNYATMRFVLMKAFRRLLEGDVPTGSAGLDKDAVMAYSADLYQLDGQMSYDRAQVMGGIIASFSPTQTAFLNTNMVGKGMLDWPAVTEPSDMQGLDRDVKEALMTYAGDIYSWYAGSLEADVYFCPERQGTYFGSFYLKDTPVMSAGGTIDSNLTANVGITFVLTLSPTQASLVTGLVDIQRQDLNEIVARRQEMSTQFRRFIAGQPVSLTEVLSQANRYGELDGEIVYHIATNFAAVSQTLSTSQTATLNGLREQILGEFPLIPEPYAYRYSDQIAMPTITNTDFLFLPVSATLHYPDMALIPSGEFVMGDHHNYVDPAHPSDEVPTHTVQLDAFYVGKYEVTNQQYADYLNSALAQGLIEVRSGLVFTETRSGLVYGLGADNLYFETNLATDYSQIGWDGSTFSVLNNRGNHPVVGVRWYGAAAYANWLNAQQGYTSCYNLATGDCDFTQVGYRLPTEAEWEYAARGGQYTPYYIFPWGDDADNTKANWPASGDPYETGSYPWTTPVGFYDGQLHLKADFGWPGSQTSYQTSDGANGYGLYDVAGNVWEWVHDWYGRDYYSVSPTDNPTGPLTGTLMLDGLAYRGMRGGNWYNGENGHARVANRDPSYYRGPLDPYQPYYNVGFRVARPVTVTPNVTPTVGVFINDARAWDGYTLFAPKHYTTTYLINNQGLQVHSWSGTLYEPGQSAYLLENGHLLRAAMTKGPLSTGGGEGGRIEEYDWDGNLVWQFDYSTNLYMSHHDIRMLPNGNVLALAVEKKTYDEALAAGFNPAKFQPEIQQKGYMLPDYVIEISPTYPSGGQIVWAWHVWDHLIQDFDATKDNYGNVAAHPELIDADGAGTQIPAFWNHMNSIDYNPQFDEILLSVRGNSEIWIIDHSTTITESVGHTGGLRGKGGDLLYRWGNPIAYKAGTASSEMLYQQHDAEWIVPGNPGAGNITVFNNGLGRNYSTVDEITPPVDASGNYTRTAGAAYGPLTLTWSYSATPASSLYAGAISGAQRLPNGNTLIDDGTHGTFTEVTPGKEIVWKYINPVVLGGPLTQGDAVPTDPARTDEFMNAVFRVYRYAPTYPGLIGRDLTPGQPVELYTTPVTTFALAVHSTGNGTGVVTNTPGGTVFLAGTVVTLTATPNPGSVFAGWSGACVNLSGNCMVTMSAARSVTATFTLGTFVITPTAGANGSLTPDTPQTVNHGASQPFTITANTGYHIADVGVDGNSIGSVGAYTFTNVTANHILTAAFAINTYIITPTASANGRITPSTPQTVNHGASQPFTITANAGYRILDVWVDGSSIGVVSAYTFTNVTANHTLTAAFTLNPPQNILYLPLVARW